MPTLDVSDILTDPDIADIFAVIRRVGNTNVHGRVVLTPARFDRVVGVVCAASANDLERHPEIQYMGRHLSIITRFRLQGPTPGFQPDIVEWYDNFYVVQAIDPYPQYGVGFVQAIVGSIDSIDEQLLQPARSSEVFGGVSGDAE